LEVGEDQWKGLKKVAEEVGKMFLILLLVGVVLLLTFQKRRRGKHTRSFGRDLLRKIWPEDRRRVKEENEWLKEP
jgi:uncharacterized membrane protein affecting hemolysin expression